MLTASPLPKILLGLCTMYISRRKIKNWGYFTFFCQHKCLNSKAVVCPCGLSFTRSSHLDPSSAACCVMDLQQFCVCSFTFSAQGQTSSEMSLVSKGIPIQQLVLPLVQPGDSRVPWGQRGAPAAFGSHCHEITLKRCNLPSTTLSQRLLRRKSLLVMLRKVASVL